MTSIIKADNGAISGVTGITTSADNSGTLELQATSGLVNMNNVTGGMVLPSGTTAQRPASPQAGQIRYNTTLSVVEYYASGSWQVVGAGGAPTTVEYLVVAGGGGGGLDDGGGGGAGGYLTAASYSVTVGSAITVTIGAGGCWRWLWWFCIKRK